MAHDADTHEARSHTPDASVAHADIRVTLLRVEYHLALGDVTEARMWLAVARRLTSVVR